MLSTRFIQSLLNDDFDIGMLQSDQDRRNELASITEEEITVLISRLHEVLPIIQSIRSQKQSNARKVLEDAIGASGMFKSVEELLEAITGDTPTRTTTTKKTKTNNNRIYRIELFDSKSDERRGYTITNGQMPPSLKDDPIYKALIKKNPVLEDVSEFLMVMSPEYREQHPINAKYNKIEFHINERGKLNSKAMAFYEDYIKTNPDASTIEFKKMVMDSYKKV